VTSVPISITVADAGQLERQQVRTVDDLARIAPSLEMTAAAGQGTGGGGEIRGIGTQTFAQGAVASVGIVVDQVSQGNANISSLFDIARVEVLKGPQGTLFGLTGSYQHHHQQADMTKFSARLHADLSNGDRRIRFRQSGDPGRGQPSPCRQCSPARVGIDQFASGAKPEHCRWQIYPEQQLQWSRPSTVGTDQQADREFHR
jgi:hypothetical protein